MKKMNETNKNLTAAQKTINNAEYADDSLCASYADQIRNLPRLSADEEKKLFQVYRAGGEGAGEARNRLVESNLRLVLTPAMKYSYGTVPFEDMINSGAIGLISAVEHFDPRQNVSFASYAGWWIKQALTRAYIKYAWSCQISTGANEDLYKVRRVRNSYLAEFGAEPTASEISVACGLEEKKVEEILHMEEKLSCGISLDAPVSEEDSASFGDLLVDQNAVDPCEYAINKVLGEEMLEALNELPPREKKVVCLFYGFYRGLDPMTLDQIAKLPEFGVSRSRIHQILQEAYEKLKKYGTFSRKEL